MTLEFRFKVVVKLLTGETATADVGISSNTVALILLTKLREDVKSMLLALTNTPFAGTLPGSLV